MATVAEVLSSLGLQEYIQKFEGKVKSFLRLCFSAMVIIVMFSFFLNVYIKVKTISKCFFECVLFLLCL